jgi:5-methylcytosine-specific restriction protein A
MTVQFLAPTKRRKISQKEAARLFLLHNGICCNCGLQIRSGEKWFIEHVDALILGGEETDDNRRPSHVRKCKAKKDAADAGARSKRDRIITKDWERGKRKMQGQGFRKAPPQRTASSPIIRKSEKEPT